MSQVHAYVGPAKALSCSSPATEAATEKDFFQPAYYDVYECAVGIVSEWLIMVTPRHIVVASIIYEVSISVVNVRAVLGSECQF